jgi:sugar transferase EpsL
MQFITENSYLDSGRLQSVNPNRVAGLYERRIKRATDIIAALLGLISLSPVMIIVAVLIRLIMGKPIFFRQERPGFNGCLFTCVKFRTMTNRRDDQGKVLKDRERIVPLGTWLRRTSLDELPQLWNVIKGDISLIGPRPMLTEYLPYYTLEEQRRHLVRPGLTGWAQIHGRNNVCFDERLKMDVWYVDHLSWHLDLRILFATFRTIISAKGTDLVSYPLLHEQRQLNLQSLAAQVRAGTLHGVER